MNHIQRIDERRGNWHRPVNTAAPLFQTLENNCTLFEVHAVGCQGKRVRDTAASVGKDMAERSYLPLVVVSGQQKGVTLGGIEVFR